MTLVCCLHHWHYELTWDRPSRRWCCKCWERGT